MIIYLRFPNNTFRVPSHPRNTDWFIWILILYYGLSLSRYKWVVIFNPEYSSKQKINRVNWPVSSNSRLEAILKWYQNSSALLPVRFRRLFVASVAYAQVVLFNTVLGGHDISMPSNDGP